jgi:hypothetical protein
VIYEDDVSGHAAFVAAAGPAVQLGHPLEASSRATTLHSSVSGKPTITDL